MAYQINLTGKEIDERLQNVGTAKDAAAADGTLYARIRKNVDDIDELRDAVGHIDSAQTATGKTVTQHTADISALQKAVGDNVRIEALDNGDASASFVAGRNLKVNGWEFYWKDVWEESEPSAIKHIESAGVNAAINEIKGTGVDVSAFTFPTTKDEFIAYLKTITFDFSNRPNQVSGYGSVTYGIMNKNAGTTTIVEGMRNAVPDKIHRSHIEGQYMTFPDVEYALDCHVEGQDCNIVGYALICHLEGNGSAVVHSMGKNVGFFEEACACHVEGGGGVAGGAYSHVEGDGCAALNTGAHCEGKGFYKNSVTDWKKRTYKDNDYLKDLWKKILFGKTDTSGYTYKFSAAIGLASHVEGMGNIAPEAYATLEGLDTGATASFVNGANHAEGAGNLAGAAASHAEGIRNEIGNNAYASHAEGIKNTTQNRAEHASGQYNKSNKASDTFGDAGNTLFSVGCGTSDADRKNAFEVMQDGTCKYYDVATGEQIDVGVAKELSKPFDLTIGSITKKVDGKSAVSFNYDEIVRSMLLFIDTNNNTIQFEESQDLTVDDPMDYQSYSIKFVVVVTAGDKFDESFVLNPTVHYNNDDNNNILLNLTGVGRINNRMVKIFAEFKSIYDANKSKYSLKITSEKFKITQFENYELVLSDLTEIDTTNSILPTTKAGWIALRNEPDLPIILKLPIGTYKCVGVTETSGVYHFEFILNNQDAQSQFGVYKLIVDTTPDAITQTVEYIDRMPKQQTATSTVNAFNGALIQKLSTESTEADIRKAFTEVNTKTVLFPTPGSVIAKLDGGNRGIVVSLSEPNATTLGRSIVVYYGDGTYTIVVKNDFTKVLVPWRKDSSLRDLYISAGAVYNEATGFYELNGLTDITEAEMKKIYKYAGTPQVRASHAYSQIRTNFPSPGYYNGSIYDGMFYASKIEVINLGYKQIQPPTILEPYVNLDGQNAFYLCKNLRIIYGRIEKYRTINDWGLTFGECAELEEVRIYRLGTNIKFSWSPNLSKESVLYMITNANPPSGAAAGSIAITLHPTAYARLKDDADIVAALEAKEGIVTLVSA